MSPNIVAIGMLGRLRGAGWPDSALAEGTAEELNRTSARERDTARTGLANIRADEQELLQQPASAYGVMVGRKESSHDERLCCDLYHVPVRTRLDGTLEPAPLPSSPTPSWLQARALTFFCLHG